MVQTWEPKQYLKFHNPRICLALYLLAKIELADPRTVYNLGCGPRDVTRLIQKKWPCAKVISVDSSQEMLGLARERYPNITWVNANLRDLEPAYTGDILFSNSVLQWIGSHGILLCRLLNCIKVGGVLAFQLPRN